MFINVLETRRLHSILLAVLLLTTGFSAWAQKDISALDSITGSVTRSMQLQVEDKVLLTANKRLYKAGERIWFRAFVVNAVSNKISTKNKILYADLVDDNDNQLSTAVLNAGQQQTSGSLLLADSLPTGNYWLRAYTKQIAMKDSLNCSVLSVYIYNPKQNAPGSQNTERSQRPIIDIYPEGGTLITGTENTVGIYAHDENGKAQELKAVIVDNRSKDSLPVFTNKYGVGSFTFSPNRYKTYTLVTSYEGKQYSYPLPSFNFWGGQVSVRQIKDQQLVIRAVLEDSLDKVNRTTYLVGIHGDSICYVNIGSGSYETSVPANNLPGGITTFILYNYKLEPISERAVYVENKSLKIDIATDKPWYKPRDKALITTSIKDQKNNAVSASVSLQVIDSVAQRLNEEIEGDELMQQFPYRKMDNWAAIHLKNFTGPQIDMMLLCQPSIANSLQSKQNSHSFVSADSFLYIKGHIVNRNGTPVANEALAFIPGSAGAGFFSDSTDPNGLFSVPLTEVMDSTVYHLQIGNAKNRTGNLVVKIDNSSFPLFTTPRRLKYIIQLPSKQVARYVNPYKDNQSLGGEALLEAVVVESKDKQTTGDEQSRRISPNSTIVSSAMIHRTKSTFMMNALRMIPGLQILNGVVVLGGLNSMRDPSASSEPLVFFDGVQVQLPPAASPVSQYFSELSANDVDFIEVFKGPQGALFGLRGGNGVIYVHSAKNIVKDPSAGANEGLYKFYAKGFTKEVAFNPLHSGSPDMIMAGRRSTLAWEGNVLNDNLGKITTSFSANAYPGTYYIVVTGITVRGNLIYETAKLEVK